MSTPNGSGPVRLRMSETPPVEQGPAEQPGPGQHGMRGGPVEIASQVIPQRFDMSIHGTDGAVILRLFENPDGIFQAVFTADRLDEAATMFANQVLAMSGRRILHGQAHPDNVGDWLARMPMGAVAQPAAVNVMNMAWHAALEAGLCNCVTCRDR